MAVSPADETLLVCGDFNGHIGESSPVFNGVHGGFGYGNQNADGVRVLDFCAASNLSIANSFFRKTPNKFITYSSGGNCSQIDFILARRCMLKHVWNVTVINNCIVLYCIYLFVENYNRYKFYCLLYYLQFYNDRRPSNLA